MGVFDGQGRRLDFWPILISNGNRFPVGPRRLSSLPEERFSEGYIYAGLYYPVFGHFITETLVNLVAIAPTLRAHPERKILFVLPTPGTLKRVFTGAYEDHFFEKLGIAKNQIKFVTQLAGYEDVLVPRTPFEKKHTYCSWITQELDKLEVPRIDGPRKVYLSRSRWSRPRVVDEVHVEGLFSDAGYEIVHPQELSLDELISLMRNVTDLAGSQGTALHFSLFSQTVRSVISLGWKSPLQAGICRVRGQHFVDPRGMMVSFKTPRLRRVSDRAVRRAIERVAGG
jgi:capsular polysaccharide biosynthesis protein